MLSRKPTAIKLTQEDLQEYDTFIAGQKEASPPRTDDTAQPRTSQKGKEVASTSQDRQHDMDERIGVMAAITTAPVAATAVAMRGMRR